ncbi:MAG: hypothetical protein JO092_01685 [Candidatus Eremiobacteraeota bacterium]|nr:hypothetical protein [Candidatus Eremiobacteraeota bacterium]
MNGARIPALRLLTIAVTLGVQAACSGTFASPSGSLHRAVALALAKPPDPLVGMTYDHLGGDYTAPVTSLGVRPTIRIPFDPDTTPSDYAAGVRNLAPIAHLMAEPVDSSEVKATPLAAYRSKFATFLAAFQNFELWEVGNELNGEWLGGKAYTHAVGLSNPPVAKAYAAWKVVSAARKATVLTLYYEPPRTVTAGYAMIEWARRNFAALPDMANGLDYVFISYYETDNDDIRPTPAQWSQLFGELHVIFPNAQLGFGEVGLDCPLGKTGRHCGHPTLAQAESIMRYYYRLVPHLPVGARWAAGDFWWYAAEDFEPTTKPLYVYFRQVVRTTNR